MRLLPPELLAGFAASRPGARLWLPGLGRSLAPLLRSGDALQFERCDEKVLRPGDIALLLRGEVATAHLVDAVSPLRTVNLKGEADAPGAAVVGRAVTLRLRGLRVPVSPIVRAALRMLLKAGTNEQTRELYRGLRTALFGELTVPLRRRWLGKVVVRPLRAADEPAVLRFAGDHLAVEAAFLSRQLNGRWNTADHAFGAFSSRGELVGFGYVDGYREEGVPLDGEWLRYQFIVPKARQLGLANQLTHAQIAASRSRGEAELFADVRSDNAVSKHLLMRLGFIEDEPLTEKLNATMRAPERHLTALKLSLDLKNHELGGGFDPPKGQSLKSN